MFLGELIHFDQVGWCILSSQKFDDDQIKSNEFITMENRNGLPGVFSTPYGIDTKSEKLCSIEYDEIDDYGTIKAGDSVFYLINDKVFTGKYKQGKVRRGKITSVNHVTQNVVIDHELTIKLLSVMSYEHNYEQIKDTDAYICETCKSIYTPISAKKLG